MVANGIVLDANEERLDELEAKSMLGWSSTQLVLTNRRVHLHQKEFMGPKKQRTFDLRHVQAVDYERKPNWLAWIALIWFSLTGLWMLTGGFIEMANDAGRGTLLVMTSLLPIGIAVFSAYFLFHKVLAISAPGQEQRVPLWKTKQERISDFGRALLRTKDSVHEPAPVAKGSQDATTRLAKLAELHRGGLITQQDYDSRKAEILQQL